jgi:hypothetical protein
MISSNLIIGDIPKRPNEDSFDIQGENIDDFSPIRRNPADDPPLIRQKHQQDLPTEEYKPNYDDRDMIETERMIG